MLFSSVGKPCIHQICICLFCLCAVRLFPFIVIYILMDGIMREASVMRTTDRAEPMRCQNCLDLVTWLIDMLRSACSRTFSSGCDFSSNKCIAFHTTDGKSITLKELPLLSSRDAYLHWQRKHLENNYFMLDHLQYFQGEPVCEPFYLVVCKRMWHLVKSNLHSYWMTTVKMAQSTQMSTACCTDR